jgi:2-keto-4-pentenoate hydratase/2-oxohepta-3-ene-1,7-dioic acid hydratase in catechol pathway
MCRFAAITIFCDWSARDLQIEEMRQRLGPAKGKDSATTIGPYLVTLDEIEPHRSGRGYEVGQLGRVTGRIVPGASPIPLRQTSVAT